jgi:hypothetical protein
MPAMTGDYSRFTFDPRKRFSGVLEQQGRVQLDADWNEAVAIFKRRIRLQALDTFGPVGVAQLTTPDAFLVSVVAGPPLDLSLKPGRIYVDGILAELFPDETASYRHQPFFPDPPPLPTGDVVVYLDLWKEREVTYIEDPALLEPALGGVDTTTRSQSIWQLKVDASPGAVCGMAVGVPASAGRLSSEAIAPPTPDDACILPPVAGYRGLENRLYRIEIHTGGALGTARFKWSRDNGSIVYTVSEIAVAGGQTTLTVSKLGRDQVLRFVVGNWVTVTDDFRELAGEPGEMARILSIDEANAKLVLDRGLPTSGGRAFGANATELAARHTRAQRWDQSAPTNAVDADGLIPTGPGLIDIEEGIRISFSVDPVGGVFNDGDYWVFWARTATALIEILNAAPPRGIHHHYVQLAAVTGLGGPSATTADCRPSPPPVGEQCCCTFVVAPGQDIQKAIDSLPPAGGCICLKTGVHLIRQTLIIARSDVRLVGESPGTTVRVSGAALALLIGVRTAVRDIVVCGIAFEREQAGDGGAVVEIGEAVRVAIEDCAARSLRPGLPVAGVAVRNAQQLTIARCLIEMVEIGIWVSGKNNSALAFVDNFLTLQTRSGTLPGFGILAQQVQSMLRIEGNVIAGAPNGILVNDEVGAAPSSSTHGAEILENWVSIVAVPTDAAVAPPAFGIDLTAGQAGVSGNMVLLPGSAKGVETGLRLTGTGLRATNNTVQLTGDPGDLPTVGIQLGYSAAGITVLTSDVVVSGNAIVGCTLGIAAFVVNGADISGNLFEAGQSRSLTAGILLAGCVGLGIHDNRAVGFTISIGSSSGAANRYADNIIATGNYGIALVQETTPMVTQNRITDMRLAAIAGIQLIARCDVTANRIAACAYGKEKSASIAVVLAHRELHIAGNEVIDSGVSPAGAQIAPAYGIAAIAVLEATVEGNQVTYTSPEKRDVSAEDRALLIGGLTLIDPSLAEPPLATGSPVQILGNKFVGAGRSALVELLEIRIDDRTVRRFERAFFSQNFCWHLVNPDRPLPVGTATVRLTGRAASVIGNQIKSVRDFPSVDFNNIPGPFMGNITSGLITRHTPLPNPVGDYNLFL